MRFSLQNGPSQLSLPPNIEHPQSPFALCPTGIELVESIVISMSFASFTAAADVLLVGGFHLSIKPSKPRVLSLVGVLAIIHLLLLVASIVAGRLLANDGGMIFVDDSNRSMVNTLHWFEFLMVSPLYTLFAPRGGFGIVWLDIAGIVTNSLFVSAGLAGIIRLTINRQFSLRFLFVLTTLMALCLFTLSYLNDTGTFILLIVATLALLILAFVSPEAKQSRRGEN